MVKLGMYAPPTKLAFIMVNPFYENNAAVTAVAPGIAYTLMKGNWDYLPYPPNMRGSLIISYYYGNEAGAGKGIRLQNVTDGVTLAEITWDGAATQVHWASADFVFPVSGKRLAIQCKGSSATENIAVANVWIVTYG